MESTPASSSGPVNAGGIPEATKGLKGLKGLK